MKKNLLLFYLKMALAIGVPVAGVATIVAIVGNNTEINQDEIINILESEYDETIEMPWTQTDTSYTSAGENAKQTESAEDITSSASIYENPTTPIPTVPEPTTPAPTVPITTTATGYSVKYTYDKLGRVIKAEYETHILEYVYDKNGNILEVKKTLK